MGAAVVAQADAASSSAPPAPGANGHRGPHIMPFGLTPPSTRGGGTKAPVPGDLGGIGTPAVSPAGAHLTYFGGRVISNVQVVQVLWGTGSYLPQTTTTAVPSMASFFRALTGSNYMDWLNTEYNTVNNSFNGTKTNQSIGRGAFVNQIMITPSANANGATVDDTVIQTELSAQIGQGHLPAPTRDAAGNTNTIYALFFRHGQNITQGGSVSLQPGGFCAYHGTVAPNGGTPEFYYSVLPDLVGISGCGTGTDFQNTTSVMSHELIESVTDAEVGLAVSNGPPLAWYDNTNGEIGDICNAQQGSFGPVADGQTYTVQQEFSNAQNNCIVPTYQAPAPGNDFSLSANPASLSVAAGGSASSTITTSVTSGSAVAVALTVSGAPSGMTATLSPTSVMAGQSATVSISTTTALPGSYALTITGAAGGASHSSTIAVTVTSATGGSGIMNGGFEAGSLAGWTAAGASETVVSSGCHSGAFCAELGSSSPTNGDSTISQTFSAPSGVTGISLWYKETCPDTVTYDWALATLQDFTNGATATLIAKACTTNAWTQVSGSISAGHSYKLTLTSHDDDYSGDPTFTLYDDVTLSTGAPPTGGITNGGFETGSFSGWNTAGASKTVVNIGCHSGTYCARLGSTSPTAGDSSVSQTFTVPAGKSQLSVWYKETCPDTVTYDWATVTLKNNSTGASTTPLSNTCTTAGWTSVTAAVTAGQSYTLTLSSHDDDYSGDPTFTLYDDVALN